MAKRTMSAPMTLEETWLLAQALSMALLLSLEELAHQHGGEAGEWLDQLESRCLAETKSAIYDYAHAVEARGKELALEHLEIVFRVSRNSIAVKKLDP